MPNEISDEFHALEAKAKGLLKAGWAALVPAAEGIGLTTLSEIFTAAETYFASGENLPETLAVVAGMVATEEKALQAAAMGVFSAMLAKLHADAPTPPAAS